MGKKYIIGIDLGTTNSAVAIYDGEGKIIDNLLGKRTTPSIIAVKKDKKTGQTEWLVGETAKRQAVVNPLNTLYGIKRLIGRKFDDPEVTKMRELAPYKIVEADNGDAWVEVNGEKMAPAAISAKVLRNLKEAVEKYLGPDAEVNEAVITVPAYFNNSQREATKQAGIIAGLDVKRIVAEPTAAALAYGLDKKQGGKIVVYDLGGGTFDISVLEVAIDKDKAGVVNVLATDGDTFLGGENFDERIMDHLIKQIRDESGVDLSQKGNEQALQRLKEAAEKAKIELSVQDSTEIELPYLAQGDEGPINFNATLTRTQLEKLVQDLVDKTVEPCRKALAKAGLKITDIDEVILVGGQTRMPKVIETVKTFFGKEPRKDVNPDEIVAIGASAQGAVLSGKLEDVILLDVIPLSIGIQAKGDIFAPIVPRGSSIPTSKTEIFSAATKEQKNVEIKIYQGERDQASANKPLKSFVLDFDKLPPTTGQRQIAVTFNIDENGVLEVEAKDVRSGRVQKMVIEENGGLTEAEVAAMLKDAEAHAESDRLAREARTAFATAEELLKYVTEDEQQDWYQQSSEDLKKEFREAVTELTEAKDKKDIPAMIQKIEKLSNVRSAMGDAFYEAAEKKDEGAQDATAETQDPTAATEKPKKEPKTPKP